MLTYIKLNLALVFFTDYVTVFLSQISYDYLIVALGLELHFEKVCYECHSYRLLIFDFHMHDVKPLLDVVLVLN